LRTSGDGIAQLARLLLELPAAVGETILTNGGRLLPAEGSSAQREIGEQASFAGRSTQPVLDTYSYIHVRLLGSMQNLIAIGSLLPEGPLDPTCGVLARASLESAAVAWWLLGEEGDVRVRVARGRAQLLYELQQDAGILRGLEGGAEGVHLRTQIDSTISEISTDCNTIGLPTQRSSWGYVTLVDESPPTASSAVKTFSW
jgi:hypothetical protein